MSFTAVGVGVAAAGVALSAYQAANQPEAPSGFNVLGPSSVGPATPFGATLNELVNSIFTPGAIDDITDFLQNPIPLRPLEKSAELIAEVIMGIPAKNKRQQKRRDKFLPEGFEEAFSGSFLESLEALDGLSLVAQSFAETGLPPTGLEGVIDAAQQIIDPVEAAALLNFEQRFDPMARERFSSFDSDLAAILAREQGRIATEVGALETDVIMELLDAQRDILPLAAELAVLPTTFGLEAAGAAGDIGEQTRLRMESVRPGSRLFGAIPTFAQADATQALFLPGFNPVGSNNANQLQAIAGSLPFLTHGVGSLLQAFPSNQSSMGFNVGNVPAGTLNNPGVTAELLTQALAPNAIQGNTAGFNF